MDLLISGGTVVDLIFSPVSRLPTFPDHTEFTPTNLVLVGQAPIVTLGGNGANAAYAAARCGAVVALATRLGADPLGTLAHDWLHKVGCRLLHPPASKFRTAVNVTAANRRLQRGTFFYPGSPVSLPRPSGRVRYLLVCGWPHPSAAALARAFRGWHARGTKTALDLGPLLGPLPTLPGFRTAFRQLDLLLANEHELLALTRTRDVRTAVSRLRTAYAGDIVIKQGARGASWFPSGSTQHHQVPGLKVRARNTVGAGDSFNGALLAALARGAAFPSAIRSANRIAASVVRSPRGILGLTPSHQR